MDDAKKLLDDLLETNANDVDALFQRAWIDVQGDEPAKAEPRLRQVVKLAPKNALALYYLSECLKTLGKEDEAKKWFERWSSLDDDLIRLDEIRMRILHEEATDVDLRQEGGAILLRVGRDAEGLNLLRTALKLDPKHRPTHATLADYYEHAGKKDLAAEHHKLARTDDK